MKPIFCLILVYATSAVAFEASVRSFAPPLPDEIIDFYVPPTRADEPIVAINQTIYRYISDSDTWLSIYEPPWEDAKVLGISGYSKSSQCLYVVHTRGISSTSDGGQSWSESVLSDSSQDPGTLVAIAVHPSDRKHAVFAFRNNCWMTRDYAESFEQLFPNESIAGAVFVPEQSDGSAFLVVATSEALHVEGEDGTRRLALPSGGEAVHRLFAHPNLPFAYLDREDGKILVVDVAHDYGTLVGSFQSRIFAPLISGDNSLWVANDSALGILNLDKARTHHLQSTAKPITLIRAHPRRQDALYFANENQLHVLEGAFQGLPADTIASFPRARFSALDMVENLRPTHSSTNGTLVELIRSQPELQSVIAVVLARDLESPETTTAWAKRARARHWLPELRISGYARETPIDVTEIQTITDRYGLQKDDELRLSDDVRRLNWLGVTLTWDLERLAFDEDQLYAAKERRMQSAARRALAAEIAKLYYERIELVALYRGIVDSPAASKHDVSGRDKLYLAIRERTELLNAIVGQDIFSHI